MLEKYIEESNTPEKIIEDVNTALEVQNVHKTNQ